MDVRFSIFGTRTHAVTRLSAREWLPGESAVMMSSVPTVDSARFKIGDMLPSDRSASVRVLASDDARRWICGGEPTGCYLRAPAMPTDTRLYLSVIPVVAIGDRLWMARELLIVTAWGVVSDRADPYYLTPYIDVTRGAEGTTARRYDLPADTGANGPQLYRGGPMDIIGAECELVAIRTPPEPPWEEGGMTRVMLYGVVSGVVDSGDAIEITMQTGIEQMLVQRWPEVPALCPHSRHIEERIASSFPWSSFNMHMPFTGRVGWGAYTPGTGGAIRYLSARTRLGLDPPTEILRDTLISTGPVYWRRNNPTDAATVTREEAPELIERYGAQPYASIPRIADDGSSWSVLCLRGPDGYTGQARPSDAGRNATPSEYILLGLDKTVDRRTAVLANSPLWAAEAQTRGYTLGTWGYRLYREGGAEKNTHAAAGYYRTRDLQEPYHWRQGRLDAAPLTTEDRRVPGVVKPFSAVRCLTFSTAPTGIWLYIYAQLKPPTNVTGATIGAGVGGSARVLDAANAALFFADLAGSMGAAGVALSTWVPTATMQTGGGLRAAWLPEVWLGRTVRETAFTDMFVAFAVAWAPGREGRLVPVWLGNEERQAGWTIGPSDVFDRDHTVQSTPDLALERVTITGLRTSVAIRTPEDAPGYPDGDPPKGYASTPDTLDIVSTESSESGLSGQVLQLKATPYHNRDALPLASNEIPEAGAIHRTITSNWTKAVRKFGSPYPEVVLRINGARDIWPGSEGVIDLPNMPTRGKLGGEVRALCLERGDDLEAGTAECVFLLIGWYDVPQKQS